MRGHRYYRNYKKLVVRANRRNQCHLSYKELLEIVDKQSNLCYYCGNNLKYLQEGEDSKMTVDRMNNDLGYTKENIVAACYRCNRLKSDYFTADEFKEIAKRYIINRK